MTYRDRLFSYIQRYIDIFQLIRECWIFDVLIESSVNTGAIISEFYLGILTGMSAFGVAFLLFILLIFLFTSWTLKYFNENTFGSLKELFIRKILGCFLHFLIVFSTGSVSYKISGNKLLSFSTFNSLKMFLKDSLKV